MSAPAEFLNAYNGIGAKKASMPIYRMIILGILAGVLIGMGAVVSTTGSFAVANPGLQKVVAGLLFPFGLIMVVFTGAELFTGNCLISIPVMDRKVSVGGMLRNWGPVYVGNFIGSLLLAAACAYFGQIGLADGALAAAAMKTAIAKCSLSFGKALVFGIGCNFLVCLAVSCAIMAKSAPGKALGAYLPVAFFVMAGFEHSVANMYYIPVGLFAKTVPAYAAAAADAGLNLAALTWGNFLLHNLLPVTLGNIIGGVCYAAILYYGHRVKNEG